jgi:hypothetical protein
MTRSPRRLREHVKDTVSELPIHAARLAVMGVGQALLLTDRVRKDYREVRESGLGPVLGRLKNDAGNFTGMVVGKVAGNGKAEEEPKSRAGGSEISVGKPKPAGTSRPSPSRRPAPPSRPAAASRPKPATTAKPSTPKPAESKPAPSKATASKAPASKAPASKPKPAAQAKPRSPSKPAAKPKATESKPAAQAKPAAAATLSTAKGATAADLPVSGYDKATLASVRARLRGLDTKQVAELRDYERSHAARADFLRMYENRIAKLRGLR